jgi:hypothetical protein
MPHDFEQYKFVVITEFFQHLTVISFISQMYYYAKFYLILSDYVFVTLDNTCFPTLYLHYQLYPQHIVSFLGRPLLQLKCKITYYINVQHLVDSALENCALLGYYAPSSGNSVLTFWDNLYVPPSRILEYGAERLSRTVGKDLDGTDRFPETSVRN